MKINTLTPGSHPYLQPLASLAKPPAALYALGSLPKRRCPSVAIVGTRKPTAYGNEVAHMLAYDLARRGTVIISGLAFGIDSVAHRATLEAGGTTLAILASSVDMVTPRSHQALADQIIASGGAVLSEYEPTTYVRNFQLHARNRLVSGLSDAIIIIEAAARSGTLSTAAHALEQGKEVFVVPGNITSPLSVGCNKLLKQGASVVTCAEDVLEIIAPQLLEPQTSLPLGNTPLESQLIALLQTGLRDGDELRTEVGVTPAEFNQALTMMEINGTIRSLGGNQWTLR